jgi:hypothetical protein
MSAPQATRDANGPMSDMVTTARLAVLRDGEVLLDRETKRLPEVVAEDGALVRQTAIALAKRLAGDAVDTACLMHVFSSSHQTGYHVCMYVIDCTSSEAGGDQYEWCGVEALEDTCTDDNDALFGKCWIAGGGRTVKEFRSSISSSLRVRHAQ